MALLQYMKAEAFNIRALKIYKNNLKSTHPLIARSFHALAGVYKQQREHKKAEEYYLKALEIYEDAWNAGDLALVRYLKDYANLLDSYAGMLQEMGREEDAQERTNQARVIYEKYTRNIHPVDPP